MPTKYRVLGALMFAGMLPFILPGSEPRSERIYLAGGCYWGVEAVFEHVKGVRSVVSGFAIPVPDSTVPGSSLRRTTFVETVRIDYDPDRVSYPQLLEIFFLVAHDPTEVDRQGPDVGPHYRSMVFISNPEQRKAVETYLADLRAKRVYRGPIATEIALLRRFTEAGEDQQDYVVKNNNSAYVRNHDIPKLADLQRRYPALYR
jgi:peptide-methionine (S)-S-oxide reductase